MAERVFLYDEAFAAMCLIEEVLEPYLPDAGAPWEPYREQWGINGLRDVILTKLAGPCDQAWSRAEAAKHNEIEAWNAKHDDDPAKGEYPADLGSFDYDFVPRWIRLNVDWSDVNDGPRVRGTS